MEEKIYLEMKKLRVGIGSVCWYILSVVILSFIAKGLFMWSDYLMVSAEEPFTTAKFFVAALPFFGGGILIIGIVVLLIYTWLVLKRLAQED